MAQKSGKDRERKKNKSWAAGVQHFQLPPTKSDRKRKNPIDTHIQHKSNEDKKTEELDHEEGTKKKYRKTGWGGGGGNQTLDDKSGLHGTENDLGSPPLTLARSANTHKTIRQQSLTLYTPFCIIN